jgi:fatty acid desaturase
MLDLSEGQRMEIARLHELAPRRNAIVLVLLASAWGALAAATLSAPTAWLKVPGVLATGVVLHALGVLMHDSVHGTLARGRRANRWLGVACTLPVFLSRSAYRAYHLRHHRHERDGCDLDEFENVTARPGVLKAVLVGWTLVGGFYYLVHIPLHALRLGDRETRRQIVEEYLLAAVLASVLAATVPASVLLQVWLLPALATIKMAELRAWTEHLFTPGDVPERAARTITSNRLVSSLMLNLNYHLDHHLFPGVPWYRLPRLHALLAGALDRAGAPVSRSYLAHFAGAASVLFRQVGAPAITPHHGYYRHYLPVVGAPPERPSC